MTSTSGISQAEVGDAVARYVSERGRVLVVARLDPAAAIVEANQALERLAGRSLIGRDAHELVVPAQRETLDRLLAGAGGTWSERLLGLFADQRGMPLDFAVSAKRLAQGWLLIAEPAESTVAAVNERLLELNDELARAQRRIHQQNAALQHQNDRLRELDQLKDALLANVSHDLRTPLAAILGYAELMRRRGGLSPKQAQAAEVIERNARRLLRLVNDLLLLAQARAGQLRYEREPVDLGAVAGEALELTRPLAEQAQLSLRLDLPDAGSAVIEGDRLRLGQLLDNLIANAIKFTPAGGHVRIKVLADGGRTELAVEDDGPGIPEHERPRLYDAFVRGDQATAPGTGLGLAIVAEVARAHGATVELQSETGAGTRFTVGFPPRAAPA